MTFGAMRAALSSKEILFGNFASTQRLGHLPQAGSGTDIVTAILTRKHGAARNADGRKPARRCAHQERRCGLVATHEQDHPVDGIATNGFFNIHAGKIAEQHCGRAKLSFAEGHDRKLQRKAAGFPDSTFHKFSNFAEVSVAGSKFRPGVAYAYHRTAIE